MTLPIDAELPLARSGLARLDPGGLASTPGAAGGGFAAALAQAADGVAAPQRAASAAIADFSAGNDGELHKTMLTVERGDIALKFFVSVRNRALEAYREIMHMGQ